jgi:hypothetical protein
LLDFEEKYRIILIEETFNKKEVKRVASLDMSESYELTNQKIDEVVTRTSPGNYALGYVSNLTFHVRYVGRSDTDLNSRLKKWVNNSQYKRFKFSYATSPKAAFDKECKNYHDFGGDKGELDNDEHPQRPEGADWKCPVCGA